MSNVTKETKCQGIGNWSEVSSEYKYDIGLGTEDAYRLGEIAMEIRLLGHRSGTDRAIKAFCARFLNESCDDSGVVIRVKENGEVVFDTNLTPDDLRRTAALCRN